MAHCDSPSQSATPLESDQASSGVAGISLSDFIGMTADWQDIGYQKVITGVQPELFVNLRPELKQRGLSFIYQASKRVLIIMFPSHAHAHTTQAVTESLRIPMVAQRAQNPELGEYWMLYNNKGASYEEALNGSVEFQPDIGIYHDNDGLFFVEVTFTQPFNQIITKVEHMVQGQECWGLLVVFINESDVWSKPTRHYSQRDFIAKTDWLAQAKCSRVNDPYGPICVNGIDWTKGIAVEVCFFGHGWERHDGLPTMYQLSASGNLDFRNLDNELATVWNSMMAYVGNLYGIVAQPVPFAIPWDDVRKNVIAGLVLTGLARYMRWGGVTYQNHNRVRPRVILGGPSKVKRQRTV